MPRAPPAPSRRRAPRAACGLCRARAASARAGRLAQVQPHQFAHPQSGGVQQLENRAIALQDHFRFFLGMRGRFARPASICSLRAVFPRAVEEMVQFFRHRTRGTRLASSAFHRARRILLRSFLAHAEFKKLRRDASLRATDARSSPGRTWSRRLRAPRGDRFARAAALFRPGGVMKCREPRRSQRDSRIVCGEALRSWRKYG